MMAYVLMTKEGFGVHGMTSYIQPQEADHVICYSWGGSRVVRFTKDGEIDFQIIFPNALNVTACCFGGM